MKYDTKPEDGLLRIVALEDMPEIGVKAGDLGA